WCWPASTAYDCGRADQRSPAGRPHARSRPALPCSHHLLHANSPGGERVARSRAVTIATSRDLVRERRLVARRQDLVDDAVVEGIRRGHIEVAVGVRLDALGGLAGVLGQYAVDGIAQADDLTRGDLDVRRLALGAAERLVDQDRRVRQRVALAA